MKKILYFLFFLLAFLEIQGQTASDALRFSTWTPGSTARNLGAGGSMSALGADFSTISINPAGLAMYRKSEFMFTPSVNATSIDSRLISGGGNPSFNEQVTRFALENIGLVIHTNPVSADWSTVNIAFGLNRLASFRQEFSYSGVSNGSITDRFVELANGLSPDQLDQFEAGLAYDVGAIFEDSPGSNVYLNDFFGNPEVLRNQSFNATGGINELTFSVGANYKEKLMIGATIGVPIINYDQETTYGESDTTGTIEFFDNLNYREELSTSGIGINLKLGIIYRPVHALRIGVGVQTPTFMGLSDSYNSFLAFKFDDENLPFEAQSPEGTFDYSLQTPWRLSGSVGVIIQKMGFITAEVEYVDYSASQFNFTSNSTQFAEDERFVNNNIQNTFQSGLNARLGGELALNKARLRAGYGINRSPFQGDNNFNSFFTAGVGVRESSFYIDLAYQRRLTEEGFVPYTLLDPGNEQIVENNITNNRFLLTLGFRF